MINLNLSELLQNNAALLSDRSEIELFLSGRKDDALVAINDLSAEISGLKRQVRSIGEIKNFINLLIDIDLEFRQEKITYQDKRKKVDDLCRLWTNEICRYFYEGYLCESGKALQIIELLRSLKILSDGGMDINNSHNLDICEDGVRSILKYITGIVGENQFSFLFPDINNMTWSKIVVILVDLYQKILKIQIIHQQMADESQDELQEETLNLIKGAIEIGFRRFFNLYVNQYFVMPTPLRSYLIIAQLTKTKKEIELEIEIVKPKFDELIEKWQDQIDIDAKSGRYVRIENPTQASHHSQ